MRRIRIPVTTNSGGVGTGTGPAVTGLLYAVQLVDGNYDDGVDIALTSEAEDISIPLLTKANFNVDSMVYPRVAESLNSDGSALTTYAMPLVFGTPKATVAEGGNAKSGAFILYVIEL